MTLLPRLLTALVTLPLLFAALWWGGLPAIALLTLIAALLGIREFYRMLPPLPVAAAPNGLAPDELDETKTSPPPPLSPTPAPLHPASPADGNNPPQPLPLLLGIPWTAAFVLSAWAAANYRDFAIAALIILTAGAFLSLLWLIAFYRGRRWLLTAAWLIGGPVYIGFLLSHALLLADSGFGSGSSAGYELGRNWLLLALLTTFAADTGAYAVGRLLGRHKMAPALSPGKTWEGSAGGLIAAITAAIILDQLLQCCSGLGLTQWWQPALIGAALGIAAPAGDLLESKLKRLAQVKDAGRLFPGHGGILDRLDSLLLALPTAYYLALLTLL